MDRHRPFVTQFALSMLAYVVVLIASILLLQRNPEAWWRFPVALSPVIPALIGMQVIVRVAREMDELQQRIQLEAVAFSLGSTAMLTFSYGFLEGVGFPHLNWTFVLPVIVALWGIGQVIARRRYG